MADLSANAAAALTRGRAAAESLMIDTCTATRAISGRTFDDNTGTYVPTVPTTVYSGPCKVQIASLGDATTPAVEGGDPTVQQLVVQLPVDTTEWRIQDLIHLDVAVHDPQLAGRNYRVTAIHAKSYATARRLQCEEVTDA